MAPTVGVKRSATQTITLPPPDARFAVREAVRATITSPPVEAPEATAKTAVPAPAVEGFLCLEEVDGRRWSYVVDGGTGKGRGRGGAAVPVGASVRAVPLQSPLPPAEVTPGAIAINWILKDGAGRVGKMLFARQGKKFDNDLKQLRFSSDLLLEIGAGIELATAAFPQFFLPMACVANVVKNVAAVTSTSTRTPIYKAYARGENIGDVTAKGESVGNIADLLGTGLSIFISKRNPSLVTSFALLSCGYLLSSYQEVRSVVLNTLNRARFTVAVDSFIKTGYVPSLKEGNSQETIFNPPWQHEPVSIGSRFGEAFQEPASFVATRPLFEDERYMVTYNPAKDKVYALLKDQAKPDDIVKAAFHAHVLLHFINASHARKHMNSNRSDKYGNLLPLNMDFMAHIAESCKIVSSSYGTFKKKAREQGNCRFRLSFVEGSVHMERNKLLQTFENFPILCLSKSLRFTEKGEAVKEKSVSVVLLSGGQGKRMGASMPKQYLPLLGVPIALHSLKTFCLLKEVKEVVVVCDPDYKDVFEDSIENVQIPIKFALPGKERQDSVFNGLQEIDGDSELVCVHDSARPLVSSDDVKKVLEDAAVHGAAVLGVPVKATIKEVSLYHPDDDQYGELADIFGKFFLSNNYLMADSDSFVVKTLDRKTLWEMQTPQVMKPNLLRDGFELVKRDGLEVTDDVSIVEYLKHPVYITEGSYTNIKVTTPDDLLLAERLMNEK
ncbi:hypothetical protein GUJ93_ZPchr0001g31001 [Zizania palustris]|uniref:2-C-methyl-D-erythritol 4-phosphate cytidylyltransferase n=1 Tax=Zizania palustris TaxID=103762 RepID=A0A8J5RYW9_ZIZPA|nr:hypothetical protein GUJ93_ZPchr0001g31001 [Zizania palustris]